ncbi:MAG TPA: lysylphosphatidylglycerol synthase transmembrane domain-containing protein [Candidatus Krumholzibacteria bacterium]|nr:lysylphosphatidylglycerol synthase transmembrane domain-containing protein [Candidatus Krumholzibacteria bacterium]
MRRFVTFLMPMVGFAVFAFIVYRAGPGRILSALSGIDWRGVLWAPLLILVIMTVRGARWRYVIQSLGIEYSLRRSTVVWVIGFFASAVTPAKAGDVVRAFYLRNDTGRPLGEAFLTIFVDRLWDIAFVLVAGAVSVLVFSARYMRVPSAPLVVAGVLVLGAAAVVATRREWVRLLVKPMASVLIPARFRDRLSMNFNTFYDALRVHGSRPVRAVVMAAYTLVCWMLIFALAIYVARLLSLPVRPAYIVLIMPIVTLVELLPVSVSGLGTRDAAVVFFFSVVGTGAAQAVGFSIVYVLIGTYLTALAGFLLWLRHPVRWRSEQP